jgi:NADPH:quinone reductase-like Zn-dependent oxidoreductase
MKAIIRVKPGKDLSGMLVREMSSLPVLPNQVKVRMVSSRINPVDVDLMKGMPFLKFKKPQIGGIDGAGIIIETGKGVGNFKVGDTIFFYRLFTDIGTWAEEITVNVSDVAKIPANLTPVQAGSITLPLLTAYDSIMQLEAKPGEKILIHGAGGGVGFQAVQIAKKMGLFVIGTAGNNDREILNKAGIDQIIDYKTEQFDQVLKPCAVDYVFDLLGGEVLARSIRLKPKTIVSVRYIESDNIYKSGMNIPSILRWIMKLGMKKFNRLARQNEVKIIGQVTGADGSLLQKASDFIGSMNYLIRNNPVLTLKDIESKGMSKSDLGKIILFEK